MGQGARTHCYKDKRKKYIKGIIFNKYIYDSK